MCGRNSIGFRPVDFSEEYALSSSPEFKPSWNVAPSEETPLVISEDESLRGELGVWSYYPGFGNQEDWMQKEITNARVETVNSNGAFQEAWQKRRCIVPSTGFYEWKGKRGSKVPVFFHQSGDIFSMAGIYTLIETSDGLEPAYAILTRPAQPPVSEVHDREPVTLRKNQVEDYLHNELAAEELRQDEGVRLDRRQASKDTNNPENKKRNVTERKTEPLGDYC
jgi:putative SOS response-associated peptidase YedK